MKQILLILIVLLSYNLSAQIQHQGKAFGPQIKTRLLSPQSAMIHLPKFTPPEQSMAKGRVHHKSLTFAHAFEVNISPDNAGRWTTTADGQRLWQVSFYSEGAASLNVIFSKFKLPEGGKVFIYNGDMSHTIGAFTHLNNKASEVLPTLPVEGDQITVEYQAPQHPSFDAELCIGSVNHDFLGVFEKIGTFGDAASCEKDVSCYENTMYNTSSRSTVKLIIAGTELMTGTLINNSLQDGTPYIITAAHGYRDYGMNAASTLFIFNYQVPHCYTSIEGSREQSVAGGRMLCYSPNVNNSGLDFAFLKLSTKPPIAYRPVYAGWSRSASAPSQVHCIHHPQGDVKKISFDDHTLGLSSSLVIDGITYLENGHWRVKTWEEGITEGGSSGAGIFNSKSQFLGGLSGGAATCSYTRDDYFYRFDLAWDATTDGDSTLSQWLDSKASDLQEINYYIPAAVSTTQQLSHLTSTSDITAVRDDSYGNIAGNNTLGITRFVEKFACTDSSYIYGFYFVPSDGNSASVVDINIWEGQDYPETLRYSAPLQITRWGNSFLPSQQGSIGGTYLKDELSLNENFVLLPERVGTKGNFFIGFEVDNAQQNHPFGMTLYNNSSADNAFYYDTQWHSYAALEGYNKQSSLWIEAIADSRGYNPINEEREETTSIKVWPNPISNTHELNVNCSASTIEIYSIDGRHYNCPVSHHQSDNTSINTKDLNPGSYLLKLDHKTIMFLKQ